MTKASRQSFLDLVESGKRDTNKIKVYKCIERNPYCTIQDILFWSTGMNLTTIGGRVTELLDMGVIKVHGLFDSKKGTFSTLVIVTDPQEQERLSKERKEQKAQKYLLALDKLGIPVLEALSMYDTKFKTI